MKMQYKRICGVFLCVLLTLLQIPIVYADQAPIEEEPISVSISIRENAESQYLVQPLTLSCPNGTTAAGLFPILKKFAYLADYQMTEGSLLAITLEENGELKLTGGNGYWLLRINGADIESNNLPILSDGDTVEWIYYADAGEQDPDPEEPLPEVASVNTASLWNEACADALASACSWLRNYGEHNTRFIGLGAAGVSVEYQEIDALVRSVLAEQAYEDAAAVAADILAVTFCGIYAGNVSGANLLTTLSNYPDISRGGSYGAILALLAADSNGYSLPSDGINTRSTLRTVILSAQNEDGGFSSSQEEESSPYLTACALTALSRYSSYEEIRQAIQEGFAYLSSEQLASGGFTGTEDVSSARTTGAVLTALCAAGISPDSSEFTKAGGNPLDALLAYRTEVGGFAAELDGVPEEQATQQAIIALVSVKGSRSGYVLRTAIQAQDADSSESSSEKSASSAAESGDDTPEETIKRKNILFGGVGLTIGIALGGLVLVIVLLATRRSKKEDSHEN